MAGAEPPTILTTLIVFGVVQRNTTQMGANADDNETASRESVVTRNTVRHPATQQDANGRSEQIAGDECASQGERRVVPEVQDGRPEAVHTSPVHGDTDVEQQAHENWRAEQKCQSGARLSWRTLRSRIRFTFIRAAMGSVT